MRRVLLRLLQLGSGALAAFGVLVGIQVLRLRRVRLLPGHPGFWISHVVRPAADGDRGGGRLHMIVFGDSTTAGVGVDAAEASLPYRVAQLVADRRQREVRVLSYGWAGARVADLADDQVPRSLRAPADGGTSPLRRADLVMVVAGANDATHRTRLTRFRHDLRAALDRIADAAPAAEVVVASVPRLRGALTHLEPLISLADAYGAPLRRIQRHEAERAGAAFADLARDVLPRLRGVVDPATAMSADGFHPGPPVYAAWAEVIAEALDEARESVGTG
jgi:lysophospholipase L1-like esterase